MSALGAFVGAAARRGALVVQPRMGFAEPGRMRAGLAAVKAADAATVGTITLDSYTRLGRFTSVSAALHGGEPLNGYPIVNHPLAVTAAMLEGIVDAGFPVQVRHGSAHPWPVFDALVRLGIGASEGGPVSYCLPYGRTPLADAVRNWTAATRRFADLRDRRIEPHLETFGGCVMGQLCPPSLLVALSVLEAMFFTANGIRSVSLSYAQQTHHGQDVEALAALRSLAEEHLVGVDWHVVLYAYMGLYPVTRAGSEHLLALAAELAVQSGAERLIVKTAAESRRIPTVADNVDALVLAARVAGRAVRGAAPGVPAGDDRPDSPNRRESTGRPNPSPTDDATGGSSIYLQARALIAAVLELGEGDDLGRALVTAFRRGYLDVPYCLHPDNAGRTRSHLDADGRLCWAQIGAMPLGDLVPPSAQRHRVTSFGLLRDLSYVRRRFDEQAPQTQVLGHSGGR